MLVFLKYYFSLLPTDIILEIFSYFSIYDLCRVNLVNSEWKLLSIEDTLWKRQFKNCAPYYSNLEQFPTKVIPKSWREAFMEHILKNGTFNSYLGMKDVTTEDNFLVLKITLIGDSSSGKTAIYDRFLSDRFYTTDLRVSDYPSKSLTIDGHLVKLQVWDTAGQESFRLVTRSYYKNSGVLIFVFDVTNPKTLDSFEMWLHDCFSSVPLGTTMIIMGNKIDLKKHSQIDEKISAIQKKYPFIPYFETSAKEAINVEQAFQTIAKNAMKPAEEDIFFAAIY